MEQTKALNALEPFLALSKSAASPRAAADLIQRATSAPNTFIFTELLETPQIQALASSPEFSSSLTMLRIFSYGTYASLKDATGLPALNDAQKLKLRQLSLLSLVRESKGAPTDNASSTPVLGYGSLFSNLGLSSARELEELVISTIYAGLVNAQLDPKHELVRIYNVAPLRDITPGSEHPANGPGNAIGGLLSSLQAWADRCDATLQHLEEQMSGLRTEADRRAAHTAAWSERIEKLVEDEQKGVTAPGTRGAKSQMLTSVMGSSSFANVLGGGGGGGGSGGFTVPSAATAVEGMKPALRHGSKRGSGQMDASSGSDVDDEAMDVDDDDMDISEVKKRLNRRRLQG